MPQFRATRSFQTIDGSYNLHEGDVIYRDNEASLDPALAGALQRGWLVAFVDPVGGPIHKLPRPKRTIGRYELLQGDDWL